jgi:hypothetical protein
LEDDRTRQYPELDAAHRAALQAFADEHGRRWKDELGNVYWYNARIWHDHKNPGKQHGSLLHAIRNNFGPTWLWDVCDVKPTPKPKR